MAAPPRTPGSIGDGRRRYCYLAAKALHHHGLGGWRAPRPGKGGGDTGRGGVTGDRSRRGPGQREPLIVLRVRDAFRESGHVPRPAGRLTAVRCGRGGRACARRRRPAHRESRSHHRAPAEWGMGPLRLAASGQGLMISARFVIPAGSTFALGPEPQGRRLDRPGTGGTAIAPPRAVHGRRPPRLAPGRRPARGGLRCHYGGGSERRRQRTPGVCVGRGGSRRGEEQQGSEQGDERVCCAMADRGRTPLLPEIHHGGHIRGGREGA